MPDVEEGSESVNLLPPSSGTADALSLWHPFPASPSHFLPHLSSASQSSKNGKPPDLSRTFILTVWDSKQGRGEWQSHRSGPGKRGESAAPSALPSCPPLASHPGCHGGEPQGTALTGEDPPVPGEEGSPHGEATVGAVGGLLGLPAGEQQPLDVLGLQGGAGTLLGHVGPLGPAEEWKGNSQPVWAGPHRDSSSSPGVCPCLESPRCVPLGMLGGAR